MNSSKGDAHLKEHGRMCKSYPSLSEDDKLADIPSDCTIGKGQQELISPTAREYHQTGPALEPIWRGNFEIKDSPRDLALCEFVSAHPSAKVSCKAYSSSKQLPGVLQFTVYAQCQFVPHLFETKCPNRDDIALYFYPSKRGSSKSKSQYSLLLKFMTKKDFMLRSRIGAIELFVFPSSVLDADSRELNGNYFKWGVFRHIKGAETLLSSERHVNDRLTEKVQSDMVKSKNNECKGNTSATLVKTSKQK